MGENELFLKKSEEYSFGYDIVFLSEIETRVLMLISRLNRGKKRNIFQIF